MLAFGKKTPFSIMKKILSLLLLLTLFSCSDSGQINSCFSNFSFNEVVNLGNAEFVNLQVPGGSATTSVGGRRLLILRVGNDRYKAFDLQCPDGNCNSVMTYTAPTLTCPCTQKKYSSINGCPLNEDGQCLEDGSCFALVYIANKVGDNSLQITR